MAHTYDRHTQREWDRIAAESRHRARLVACYGHERADAILAGEDEKTERDVLIWRTLGQPHRRP